MFNAIYAKYVCLYLSREKERNCRFFLTKSILAILAVILIWIPMNESNNGSTIQHDDDDISIYKLLTKNSHSTASKKKSYHEWIETIKLYHIIFFFVWRPRSSSSIQIRSISISLSPSFHNILIFTFRFYIWSENLFIFFVVKAKKINK